MGSARAELMLDQAAPRAELVVGQAPPRRRGGLVERGRRARARSSAFWSVTLEILLGISLGVDIFAAMLLPMVGASEAPSALRHELHNLLSSRLVAVYANGPDAVNVIVVRGFKKVASELVAAAKVSGRWKKKVNVQEIGYELQ